MAATAVTMQGIHQASGTLPVSCKKIPSPASQAALQSSVAARPKRGRSASRYMVQASHSASAVYSRGISGRLT